MKPHLDLKAQDRVEVSFGRLPLIWTWLSASAGVLAFTGSVLGLLHPAAFYGRETDLLFNAAIAQDVVNGLLVAPLLVILAWLARRGSISSWLTLAGFLGFTAYNYSIYAFSIQFGPMFLMWVAVLGLSIFALAGTLASVVPEATSLIGRTATRLTGWVLIVTSVLFTLLWLSEIVPDLLAGVPSTSASTWNVPTNPVHVLDLAFFLPAVITSGVLLIREHVWGHATAVGSLAFLGLTTLPILATPIVSYLRASPPGWLIMMPIGALSVALWAVFFRQLRSTRRQQHTRSMGSDQR
ncbi:hypothetical protein [Pseudarthrobacter sulfonivorans]|uniref:hypothetical protein n=1 Tax=Pseudarthrobacter sulfonivorans TaxID=121292 RepID=UPI00278ACE0D|nr:hypothetical protein [Pseudarthrobacter sulfonivorans]MDP9998414.1 hypothetical protein [Pseudarthrobacter sulfonivorans]